MFHRDSFTPSDLILVKRAGPSRLKPPGSFVRLNSGGPIGIVLEIDANDLATVKWLKSGLSKLPDVCLQGI